jgi:hypothetical protein
MSSSGMLRRIALVITDVSEERIASIISDKNQPAKNVNSNYIVILRSELRLLVTAKVCS